MSIVLVSAAADGTPANSYSYDVSISADGQFVSFSCDASNLAERQGDYYGVFVKDMQSQQVIMAAIDANGQPSQEDSYNSSLSPDGRYIAFASIGTDLVGSDTNYYNDVFFKDLQSEAIIRVSSALNGSAANHSSIGGLISANNRFVTFSSHASNIGPVDTNNNDDAYVFDLQLHEISLVSSAIGGISANSGSYASAISADGQFVTFYSYASNLVSGDTNSSSDVFVRNMTTGLLSLVSVDAMGNQANGASVGGSISADGRFVAFQSTSSNLVAGDTNRRADIFVKDLQTHQVTLVSTTADGELANNGSDIPQISADGRYVAFRSYASNLVAGDANGVADIFVKDLKTDAIIRIDVSGVNLLGVSTPYQLAFAGNGAFVAFVTETHISAGDYDEYNTYRADVVFPGVIHGDDADNVLTGGAADESFIGLGGDDTLSGGAGDDLLLGGDGNDQVFGDSHRDSLDGGVGNDMLAGGAGKDTLDGGTGRDRLHGGNGDDLLLGGDGMDTLIGGLDRDTLTGGAGNDIFLYKAVANSPFGDADAITDFVNGQDRIDLRPIGAAAFVAGGGAFIGSDGVVEVRFLAGHVQVDANDDGVFGPGDLQIDGLASLTAADLILA